MLFFIVERGNDLYIDYDVFLSPYWGKSPLSPLFTPS